MTQTEDIGTNRAPLIISDEVLADVVRHCQEAYPEEACGYIVAHPQDVRRGVRVAKMRNASKGDRQQNADMDPDEVLAFYEACDALGNEPIAVYHSHTSSPPKMSDKDLQRAVDPALAYMIVSLEDPHRPLARAYRVWSEFIGERSHREIRIQVGAPVTYEAPKTPWALAPGNHVRLSYTRPSSSSPHEVFVHIKDVADDFMLLERLPGSTGTVPERLAIARVKAVRVIHEGATGREIRRRMLAASRHITAAVGSADPVNLAAPAAALAAAFPQGLDVTVQEG